MRVRFNRWYNAVLTALLSLLGFEACNSDSLEEYGTPAPEYGVPIGEYHVRGQVTQMSGTPIQGIRVTAPAGVYDGKEGESVLTDENGYYELKAFRAMPHDPLIVEDIDGAANGGEFESDTVSISDLSVHQVAKGEGTWDMGKNEVSGVIRLKEKSE